MGKSWLDTKDSVLLPFAQAYSTKITANPTRYNYVVGDATALAALVATYQTNLALANDPATRTSVTIAAKDVAKAALITELRALYRKLGGAIPAISADKREELGLPPKDVTPSPSHAPSTRPVVTILSTVDRTVSVRIADETTPTKRARPAGASGLEIFSFQGDVAPADLGQWKFEGLSPKSDFSIAFPSTVAPGTKVWVVARWYNRNGETSPLSASVTTYVGGGVSLAA